MKILNNNLTSSNNLHQRYIYLNNVKSVGTFIQFILHFKIYEKNVKSTSFLFGKLANLIFSNTN